jgi:hypothetical protein
LQHRKNDCDHNDAKVKNGSFSKLFSGFRFWTFLKMSEFHFPFDFLEKSCDCKNWSKNTRKNVSIYGHKYFNGIKQQIFSHNDGLKPQAAIA